MKDTNANRNSIIIHVNKIEIEPSVVHAFCSPPPPPHPTPTRCLGFIRLDPSKASWAEHKATQSLTFIPVGRSDSSGLTLLPFPLAVGGK